MSKISKELKENISDIRDATKLGMLWAAIVGIASYDATVLTVVGIGNSAGLILSEMYIANLKRDEAVEKRKTNQPSKPQ